MALRAVRKGKIRVSWVEVPNPAWEGASLRKDLGSYCEGEVSFFWNVELVVSTSLKHMKTCEMTISVPTVSLRRQDVCTEMSQAVGFGGGLGIFPMSAFGALNRSWGRWEDAADGRHLGCLASGEVGVLDGVPGSASYPLCDLVTSPLPVGPHFPICGMRRLD